MEDEPIRGTYVSAPVDWVPAEAPARARITTRLTAAPPARVLTPQRSGMGRVSWLLLSTVLILGLLLGGVGGGAAAWMLTRTTAVTTTTTTAANPAPPAASAPTSAQPVAA